MHSDAPTRPETLCDLVNFFSAIIGTGSKTGTNQLFNSRYNADNLGHRYTNSSKRRDAQHNSLRDVPVSDVDERFTTIRDAKP